MSRAADLNQLLADGASMRVTADGMASSVPADDEGAPYDSHARFYDRLVGSVSYNRLVWRADTKAYASFAREAFASGTGPFLDVGCGTAVFTSEVYREGSRELVLVDRSLGMLARALHRVGGRQHAAALQADLYRLPVRAGAASTIGCFAMLHVLPRPLDAIGALAEQLPEGGQLFASMLVLGAGRVPDRYLRLLQRRGEMGPLQTAAALEAAGREHFATASVVRRGAMAYLRATR